MSDSNEKGKGEWSKREIGALWLKKSQAGNKFLSGHVETSEGEGLEENKERIMVWPNKDKKNQNAPDYRIYRSEPRQQESDSSVKAKEVEEEKNEQTEEELDVL